VGSIFRTADAAGVSRIILCGYTPTPLDRFRRERKDFSKVSLGAEKSVPWEYVSRPAAAIARLKRGGFVMLALEQDARSTSLFDFTLPKNKPLALILGNEVRGLSKSLRGAADHILEIPMHGTKESLNVSVAAGIALFALIR
jgi:23S rRNA (guanosine2251-2'-O)-methyltransferase